MKHHALSKIKGSIPLVNCLKYCGVQLCTDETTIPFADLDKESEDEQEGDGGSQDEELQELVQHFDPDLNACDYIMLMKIYLIVTLVTIMKIGEKELRTEVLSSDQAKKHVVSESDSDKADESDKESPSTIIRNFLKKKEKNNCLKTCS